MQAIAADGYLYMLAITLAKVSLLLFLYRLFRVDPKFRYASWALGTEVTLWGKISILLALFSYRPLSAQFNFIERFDPKTVCKSQNYDIMNVYGFYNIITDFALVDAHAGALESSDEAGERELELLLSLQHASDRSFLSHSGAFG